MSTKPTGGWSSKPASVLQATAAAFAAKKDDTRPVMPARSASQRNQQRKPPPARAASAPLRGISGDAGRGGVKRSRSKNTGGKGGNNNNNTQRILSRLEDIELHTPGSGSTEQERSVVRHTFTSFFSVRLQYMDPPEDFKPHQRCAWRDDQMRQEHIDAEMKALWDFEPLMVNDETRWKARVMKKDDRNDEDKASEQEEIMGKATSILNKLSWTTLEKLTVRFVETLHGTKAANDAESTTTLSKEIVQLSLKMVVEKAMMESHFAELYARFSGTLATLHKIFKKTLLKICQEEFELTDQQEANVAHIEDPAEREYALRNSRKASIGLMRFIGELYKLELIKDGIMIGCLQRLLVIEDEERLECFANLMTTVGERLQKMETPEPEVAAIWKMVESMAGESPTADGPKAPSVRIKFLLQDLLELKQSGWVARRKEEKAKTISQIHQEAIEEERAATRRGGQKRQPVVRSKSVTMPSQKAGGTPPKPPPSGVTRQPSVENDDGFTTVATKPKKIPPRRSSSDGVKTLTSKLSSLQMATQKPQAKKKTYLAPKEVADKTKSILKEYFIGGDIDDAVLSFEELIGVGSNFDAERGTAAIEAGVLLVLEMKEEQVSQFLAVIRALVENRQLPMISLAKGLMDPFEFLRDIQIDAPLAQHLLAKILAEWTGEKWIDLAVLLSAPAYFLSDGQPEELAKDVLQVRGDEISDAEAKVVLDLLPEEKREALADTIRDWIMTK